MHFGGLCEFDLRASPVVRPLFIWVIFKDWQIIVGAGTERKAAPSLAEILFLWVDYYYETLTFGGLKKLKA